MALMLTSNPYSIGPKSALRKRSLPSVTSELIPHGEIHRVVECLPLSVRGLARQRWLVPGNTAAAVVGEVVAERPAEFLAAMAETNASEMQVGIRIQR